MDKSERYLKEIARNTADIAKELKRMNRRGEGVAFTFNGESVQEIVEREDNLDEAMNDALNDRN